MVKTGIAKRFLLFVGLLLYATAAFAQPSYPPPTIQYGAGTPDTCFATTISSPLTGSVSGGACTISIPDPLPVANGGTAASTAQAAFTNIARIALSNDTTTGTLTNGLAKLTTDNPTKLKKTSTSDTNGAIGICVSGCGISSTGIVQVAGQASCVFENSTTAGNYFGIGTGTAGNCRDLGATYPTTGQVLGRITEGGSSGTRAVLLWGVDIDPVFSRFGPTVEPGELAQPFTMGAGNTFDGNSGSNAASWRIPRKTDCSSVASEGGLCWDSDEDVLYIGNASTATALLSNPTLVPLVGNLGAGPVDMIRFGNDTGKIRFSQATTGIFQISQNWNPVTVARDDTGVAGSIIEVAPGGVTKIYNVGVFGAFALFWYDGSTSLSIGTGAAPARNLDLGGTTDRTIGVVQQATGSTAGSKLTINAGQAASGSTNLNGGNLVLAPGGSSGTGKAQTVLQATKGGSSGTGVNTAGNAFFVDGGTGANLGPHLEAEDANAPTAGTCGTSPTITTGSTDTAGEITIGSGTPGTTCTVNFTSTWTNTPFCLFQWSGDPGGTGRYWVTSSTTTVVLNVNTGNLPASTKWRWVCVGRQ